MSSVSPKKYVFVATEDISLVAMEVIGSVAMDAISSMKRLQQGSSVGAEAI